MKPARASRWINRIILGALAVGILLAATGQAHPRYYYNWSVASDVPTSDAQPFSLAWVNSCPHDAVDQALEGLDWGEVSGDPDEDGQTFSAGGVLFCPGELAWNQTLTILDQVALNAAATICQNPDDDVICGEFDEFHERFCGSIRLSEATTPQWDPALGTVVFLHGVVHGNPVTGCDVATAGKITHG